MRGLLAVLLSLVLATASAALAQDSAEPATPQPGETDAAVEARLEVAPREATVGDALVATLTVELPAGSKPSGQRIGPTIGAFSVLEETWSGPEAVDDLSRWIWSARLAAYEVGELELPAIRVSIEGDDGQTTTVRTEPLEITIASVLEPGESDEAPELADLKPPASISPNYRPLAVAGALLFLLLAASGVLWWLHRRYASRLAAVSGPANPFDRVPPHDWVYSELQKLLERHLPDRGEIDAFFEELSRILKFYLGGRYRVDLLESTTFEVSPLLAQAGAPDSVVDDVERLLELADRVKFARQRPDVPACRAAVDEVYGIVDRTKPAQDEGDPQRGAA